MKLVSLFSGIGGFELAAEAVGWEPIVSCEINPFGQTVLEYYWPNAYHHDDIHTLTKRLLNEKIGKDWQSDDIVLTGGFPCQPYSQAGKRLGKNDERHLWSEMLRVIRQINPKWVVGENVRGLTNWNGGVVFEEVCADLEALGYEVQPFLLPAAGVDAPHRRDRIWFVAYSKDRRCGGWTSQQCSMRKRKLLSRKRAGCSMGSEIERCGGKWITSYAKLKGSQRHYEWSGRSEHRSNERIQPWSKSEFTITHSSSNGHQDRYSQTGRTKRSSKKRGLLKFERICSKFTSSNAYRQRSQEFNFPKQPGRTKLSDRSNHKAGQSASSNTNGGRQSREEYRKEKSRWIAEKSLPSDWENFPTQSPICSGDDGIPEALDFGTVFNTIENPKKPITYSRWRNESIKAYGNAIVPQVALQIFKAIVEYEKLNV